MSLKLLYSEIEQKIKSELDFVQTVDLWNNQINNEKDNALLFPCLLVDFDLRALSNFGLGKSQKQTSELEIGFYFGCEQYEDGLSGLEYMDWLEKIFYCFQYFERDYLNPLERISVEKVQNETNVILYKVVFKALFFDEIEKELRLVSPNVRVMV